jgi:FkbM family methyltransferase
MKTDRSPSSGGVADESGPLAPAYVDALAALDPATTCYQELVERTGAGRATRTHMVERAASWVRRRRGHAGDDRVWNRLRPYFDRLLVHLHPTGIEWNINGMDRVRLHPSLRMISVIHEPQAWHRVMSEIRPGDVIVDVGASIGLYSVAMAQRAGPTGRVIAYEPDLHNGILLGEHVRLNALADRVRMVPAAVGAMNGPLHFQGGGGPYSHITLTAGIGSFAVPCVTLDDELAGRSVDVLKIDVEGFEEEVLKGARRLLADRARGPRFILFEVHPWRWEQLGLSTTVGSLVRLLEAEGYELATPDGSPLPESGGSLDVVACRNG